MSELKLNLDEFVTVVVAEEINDPGSRYFLVAPTNYHFDIIDEVVTESGREFKVLFASSYVTYDSELYIALISAFESPFKITMHKAVKKIEWGDEDEGVAVSSPDNSTGRLGSEV